MKIPSLNKLFTYTSHNLFPFICETCSDSSPVSPPNGGSAELESDGFFSYKNLFQIFSHWQENSKLSSFSKLGVDFYFTTM